MQHDRLKRALIDTARSLFQRGYAFGTAGNISCRQENTLYCTPTGSSLGDLGLDDVSVCELDGRLISGNKPTKELPFHLAAYRARPDCRAVVHLHSAYATALSCLADLNLENALPALTPYFAMRVPCLPVIGYYPPGDSRLAIELERLAPDTPALLMRNHGTIAAGKTLLEASALAEEIEETARLYFILGARGRELSSDEVAKLRKRSMS